MFLGSRTMYSSRSVDSRGLLSRILIFWYPQWGWATLNYPFPSRWCSAEGAGREWFRPLTLATTPTVSVVWARHYSKLQLNSLSYELPGTGLTDETRVVSPPHRSGCSPPLVTIHLKYILGRFCSENYDFLCPKIGPMRGRIVSAKINDLGCFFWKLRFSVSKSWAHVPPHCVS